MDDRTPAVVAVVSLLETPGLTVPTIATRCGIGRDEAAAMLDRLRGLELVEPREARSGYALTERGREAAVELEQSARPSVEPIVRRLRRANPHIESYAGP